MNDTPQIERKWYKLNDLYFAGKKKRRLAKAKLSLQAYIFYKIKAQALYIIRPKTSISRFRTSISSSRRKYTPRRDDMVVK